MGRCHVRKTRSKFGELGGSPAHTPYRAGALAHTVADAALVPMWWMPVPIKLGVSELNLSRSSHRLDILAESRADSGQQCHCAPVPTRIYPEGCGALAFVCEPESDHHWQDDPQCGAYGPCASESEI